MYSKYFMLIQLRNNRAVRKYIIIGLVTTFSFIFIYGFNIPNCFSYKSSINAYNSGQERYVISRSDESNNRYVYDHDIPLIFIGGMPRSGTTLLRVLLDAHSWIRCGEETRIIPRILGIRQQWMKQPFEARRLQEAGITPEVLDSAVSAFILEVVAKHGPPAQRLCNKDPFTLRSAVYLKQLFPNSKFIFMIRDGRAVVHSIISRKVTISGFDLNDFRQCMEKWNMAMSAMHNQCQQLGPESCLPVYYEKLVLRPKEWLEKILSFLDVPWEDAVLHHEKLINIPGGISLSKLERSTDQVIKPINVEALTKWVGHIDKDVVRDMAQIAPMLAIFGYDPNANPPDYGKPDALILNTMKELDSNRELWEKKQQEINILREKIRKSLSDKVSWTNNPFENSRPSSLNQSKAS